MGLELAVGHEFDLLRGWIDHHNVPLTLVPLRSEPRPRETLADRVANDRELSEEPLLRSQSLRAMNCRLVSIRSWVSGSSRRRTPTSSGCHVDAPSPRS
jgi:hypothetical protein